MRAAERAAQSSRPGPSTERVEEFPPEPDDPFPPDPQDDYRPREQPSSGAARGAAAAPASGGRWSDALPGGEEHSGGAPAPAAAATGTAAGGEIPVVEDEGRDSLPPEESRTYGQNALRRALAEGRVVHSRPAQKPAAGAAAPGGDTWAERADAPAEGASEQGEQAWPPALQAVPPISPSSTDGTPSADAAPSSPAPEDSASARAAASWGTAATAPAPQSPPAWAPASAPASAAPSSTAPSAPRSGAALVREAAQVTRTGGLRTGNRPGGASAEPGAEADPTGGAHRDDEDAVVATRNGREVVEKLLGGKVLEIIDESRSY